MEQHMSQQILSGKNVLITGGTSGIGLATAKRFIAEGARVAVTGRTPAGLDDTRRALGDSALVIESDAGNPSAQIDLAELLRQEFGSLDVVFVNAGVAAFQPIEAVSVEEFDRQFSINLKGPVLLMKALSPLLASPASVIFNASVVASVGFPNSAIYSATKGGLAALARGLAIEWAARGIRVNSISPGPISTAIQQKLGLEPEAVVEFNRQVRESVPLKRFGEDHEVAELALFLASQASSYISGTDIPVDGGRSIA
jgi:NAD(P)-dependent dehydrogenase (short-subunit alcohol dehydrogenase family)